jgi:hypothetical protein
MGTPGNSGRKIYSRQESSVADRRCAYRYEAVATKAWLGWWEAEHFRSTNAHLVDISLRGCMMTVDQLPPPDQPVWFCPPGTCPSEWIEARLIESKRRLFGPRVVRIAFLKPFPYETFKHLVYGPDGVGGQLNNAKPKPESKRDYW